MMGECDFEDMSTDEDGFVTIYAAPNQFEGIKAALEGANPEIEFEECSVDLIPTTYVDLDEDHEAKFKRLLSLLRELDDVSEIYHNANITEDEE